MLNINKTITNGKAVFALEGRLDTNTSVELDAALSPVLDTINHKSLSKKGGMKVTNVNEMIMEIFEVTGFSDILTIE